MCPTPTTPTRKVFIICRGKPLASHGTLTASPTDLQPVHYSSTVFQEPFVGTRNPIAQRDRRRPAKLSQLGNIQKFAGRAVRLGRIPREFTVKTNHLTDQLR